MIENLKLFMKKKFNYKFNEFKHCVSEEKSSKLQLLPVYVFIVVLILYVIQALGIITEVYELPVYIIVAVLLGMWQFMLFQNHKTQSLIVTPEYLIKSMGNRSFVAIKFVEIKKFKVNEKLGLVISDKKNELAISPVFYADDLESIIDILEAKGKTFDKSREYMKRPVEIRIVKGKIIVSDLVQEESSTEKIVGQYYDQFKMLTPGFIEDIIFTNSIVDETFNNDNNLVLLLNKMEVKEGHPENTGFDSIIASECITIFEDIKIKSISIKNSRDRLTEEEVLPNEMSSICDNIEKGVIADWKYRKKGIDLHIAAGVNIVKVSFDYKEVIIGWNQSS